MFRTSRTPSKRASDALGLPSAHEHNDKQNHEKASNKIMATGANATKVVTGEVRLGYVHLFEPYSMNGDTDKAKYSCVILIPKSDRTTLAKLEKARQAAAEAGKQSKFNGKIPANLHSTLRDGDEEGDLEKNPEYEGHMFMSVSSVGKPGVVDRALNPIMDSSEVYSGCYARVSLNAFPYNYMGKKGISFGLNHVQKLRDGEFLGGRTRAEDDFDALDDEDEDGLL